MTVSGLILLHLVSTTLSVSGHPVYSMVLIKCREMIFAGLQQFWQAKLFSDVDLLIGQLTFHSHRVVLCAHSPVFQAMFTTDMRECLASKIQLHSAYPLALEQVINFMYEGKYFQY